MTEIKYLTFKQFKDFLKMITDAEAGSNPYLPRNLIIFNLLFFSLCRITEFSLIKISDLDLTARKLYIPKENVKGKNKSRTILLPIDLIISLQQWIIRCPKSQTYLFENPKTKGPFSKRYYQYLFSEYFEEKNYARKLMLTFVMSPHNMRHSGSIWLISSGIPQQALTRLLSHSSPKTTEVYAKMGMGESVKAQEEIFKKEFNE